MALSFTELRQYFIDNLLNALAVPPDKLNELVDELLTTCEFQLGNVSDFFKGPAATTDDPGTPSNACIYQAEGPGTYPNFGGLVITGNFSFLTWDGSSWSKNDNSIDMTDYAKKVLDDDLDANGNEITNLANDLTDGRNALPLGKQYFKHHANYVSIINAGVYLEDVILGVKVTNAENGYEYCIRQISNDNGASNEGVYIYKVNISTSVETKITNITEDMGGPLSGIQIIEPEMLSDANGAVIELTINYDLFGGAAVGSGSTRVFIKDTYISKAISGDFDMNNNKIIGVYNDLTDGSAVLSLGKKFFKYHSDYVSVVNTGVYLEDVILGVKVTNAEYGYDYCIRQISNDNGTSNDGVYMYKVNISTSVETKITNNTEDMGGPLSGIQIIEPEMLSDANGTIIELTINYDLFGGAAVGSGATRVFIDDFYIELSASEIENEVRYETVNIAISTDSHVTLSGTRFKFFQELMVMMNRLPADFHIYLGDYIDDPVSVTGFDDLLDDMEIVKAFLNTPTFHTLGNNDVPIDSLTEVANFYDHCTDAYYQDTRSYSHSEGTLGYYHATIRGIDLFVLNPHHAITPPAVDGDRELDATQEAWLQAELNALTGSDKRVIVTCHFPIGIIGNISEAQQIRVRAMLEAWEIANGIVLGVFNGHQHDNVLTTINDINYVCFENSYGALETGLIDDAAFALVRWDETNKILTIEGFGKQDSYEFDYSDK